MGNNFPRPSSLVHLSDIPNETTWFHTIENVEDYVVGGLVEDIRKSNAKIIWNVGIGDGSGLLGFMLRMCKKAVHKLANFDHVIRISVPSISDGCSSSDEIRNKAIIAISNELKITDEDHTLMNLKNELEEETYFTYNVNKEKESNLIEQLKNKINENLASKCCLVIVENILQPLLDPTNNWLFNSGLPVPTKYGKNNSFWVISTMSVQAYDQSKRETTLFLDHHICYLKELIEQITFPVAIIELELFHLAKTISTSRPQKLTTLMDVLWSCLLYTQLYSHERNTKEKSCCSNCVQQKELLNLWISEGIFSRVPEVTHVTRVMQEVFEIEEDGQYKIEVEHFRWGGGDETEILRALLSHSLLLSSCDASCVVPFSGMWELLTLWTKNIPPGLVQKTPWLATRWELIKNISVKKCVDKISWVSFFNNTGRWIIHPRPNPTTSLVLRCCSDLSKFSLETLFPLLKHLRILDLSYTSLEQMPPSISLMVNLRFLSLKGCNQLMTLTPNSSLNSSSSPFTALQHVEVLDLGGTSLNTIPDDVAKSKFMLRYLDLSCSSITSLSSFFFQDICSSLKELFFLGCTSLQSLPSSLINLINLETFSLSESQITSLPKETFERMSKLRDLNFKNNKLLLCLPKLAEHTKLKSLSLSGSPITHLSLQGCQSLKTVSLYDLDQLEELVLSATGIKEFPECILDLHRLRRLDLLALPQLRRLPWHKLHHIPEVFNFDQCECETMGDPQFVVHRSIEENLQLSSINNGVRFFLTDSKLFSSFTSQVCKHLVHEEGSLRSFYILVSSCNERRRKDIGIGVRDQFKKKTPSCYKDIPFMESTFKQQFEQSPPFSRHVEISSAERYPAGLEDILKVTESLSMSDDVFVSSLTDLNQDFPKLQNCQLQKCHLMDSIFVGNVNVQAPNLQTLWVSDLRNMKTVLSKQTFKEDNNDIYTRINPLDLFFREEKNLRQEILRRDIRQQAFVIRAALRFAAAGIPRNNFIAVKHIHLEYCPRLECIFSDDLTLYNLETLTVVHCNNLRTVFDQDKRGVKNHFLKLHSIQLHELPKLSHFDEKQKAYHQMPGWKELHFRGCWNLRRLPLLVGPRHQKVHVDGEARQCKKLQAVMGEDQISYYDFMSPPPLASFRECVKNKIFLR